MSDTIYPRSPYETMDGWLHLPRLVDKIRLHEAGQLHEDYQPNYLHKGFDLAWFEASGVAPDTLVEVVKNSITDGQVLNPSPHSLTKASHRARYFRSGSF